MECAFCAIVAGDVPADVILDEPDFVAFLDRRPVFKGHVLLVPRSHVPTLLDLPERLNAGLTEAARRLAAAAVTGLGAQGTFVAMNNIVSQSVPHLHVHVVPRTKGDGLRGFFWPRTTYASDEESVSYAARLTSALMPRPRPGTS
jgi:histidine triad (HIT) family protein